MAHTSWFCGPPLFPAVGVSVTQVMDLGQLGPPLNSPVSRLQGPQPQADKGHDSQALGKERVSPRAWRSLNSQPPPESPSAPGVLTRSPRRAADKATSHVYPPDVSSPAPPQTGRRLASQILQRSQPKPSDILPRNLFPHRVFSLSAFQGEALARSATLFTPVLGHSPQETRLLLCKLTLYIAVFGCDGQSHSQTLSRIPEGWAGWETGM